MGYYRGGGRINREDMPQINWDEIFQRQPPNLTRPILIGGILLLLWLAFQFLPRLYTDFRWFEELGYASVFTTELQARVVTFFAAMLVFFVFYAINIAIARKLTPRVTDDSSRLAQFAAFAGKSMNFLLLAGGLVLGLFVGLIAQGQWLMFLRYANAMAFGVSDPVFKQDIGFYVFTMPVYQFLVSWVSGAIILTAIGVGVTYMMGLGRLKWISAVKGHLSALGVAFLALSAWNYQLEIYNLVYSERGVVFGPSYTDVNAQIPAYNILTFITLGLAALLLVNVFTRALKAIGIAVVLWIGAWILLGQAYPDFVQNFEVKPNEFTKEQAYIKNNITLTRQAYALDGIVDAPFPAEDAPTPQDIQRNADVINNIRLSDYRPLLQTYDQIQTIRTYYDFLDVDVDRYMLNGKYRQTMISARELVSNKLPEKAQTWVNLHLVYTHGYGVALSPVNEFTADGLPSLLVKDIPPTGAITITRPEIYFGETTSNYIFVKTKEKEFDYPKGDENAFTTYTGTGGVPIASFWDQLMFTLRFGDMNILLTDALTGESRVMFNRAIQARVNRVAPFLRLDSDPYLVIADGRLWWIQDAYTFTSRYPLSEHFTPDLNYLRNSVKIVIDAYNGATAFYLAEPDEPLVKTYRAIFPALFKPLDQMPQELRAHLRYPEDLFTIQAKMYQTYHMQDAQVFYNKEDLWAIPNDATEGAAQAMEPYYVIMRLPGETREEFMLMQPFTPVRKQNMIAWLSAKSDGEDYGKRLVYRFPKDKLIYGPEQIQARLNQDPKISSELTLLNQRGSRIVWGNLLVIPVEKSLLYVRPMYLLAEQSQIPQLKRVVIATSTNIVMEPSLGEALVRVFGASPAPVVTAPTSPTQPTTPTNPTLNELIKQANERYTKAQDALKTADWATYGKEMQELQKILNQLSQLTGQK